MSQRIVSFMMLFFVCIPLVMSDDIPVMYCDGDVLLGVNAHPPIDLFSDSCKRLTSRTYACECNNGILELYSKDLDKEYDLILEYKINNELMRRRINDYKFTDTYSNEMFNKIMFWMICLFLGFLFIPILMIFNAVKYIREND